MRLLVLFYGVVAAAALKNANYKSHLLRIPALGRIADLGDFYDITREEFIGISAYEDELPPQSTKLTRHVSVSINSKVIRTYEERNKLMGLTSSLEVAAYADQISLKGSSEMARSFSLDRETISAAMMYKEVRCSERIKLRKKSVKKKFKPDLGVALGATHIVHGIVWGANVYFGLHFASSSMTTKTSMEHEIEGGLEGIAASLRTSSTFNTSKYQKLMQTDFEVSYYGDVRLQAPLPSNFTEIMKIIEMLPEWISSEQGGKGQMIQYILMPIDVAKEVTSAKKPEDIKLNVPKNSSDQVAVSILEKDVLDSFYDYESCISLSNSVERMIMGAGTELPGVLKEEAVVSRRNFMALKSKYGSKVSRLMFFLKTNFTDEHKVELTDKITTFRNVTMNFRRNVTCIEEKINNKLSDRATMVGRGIVFLSSKETTQHVVQKFPLERIFILYIKELWRTNAPEKWNDSFLTLLRLPGKRFIMDCDFRNSDTHCGVKGPTIKEFEFGHVAKEDVLLPKELFDSKKVDDGNYVIRGLLE